MTSTSISGLLLVALLSASPALPRADADSHRQAVETLFRLTHMEQKNSESVDNVLLIQLQQDPQLEPHKPALRAFLEKHIGWKSMKDGLVTMYMQAFTEQELSEMNAFYMTPTGQKVITDVPKLVQRRNQMAMQRIQQNIGELQKLITQPPPGQ